MEAIKANLLSHQIGSFSQRSRYWSRFVTPAGGDDAGSMYRILKPWRASSVVAMIFSASSSC
jgi:hypothetical protein